MGRGSEAEGNRGAWWIAEITKLIYCISNQISKLEERHAHAKLGRIKHRGDVIGGLRDTLMKASKETGFHSQVAVTKTQHEEEKASKTDVVETHAAQTDVVEKYANVSSKDWAARVGHGPKGKQQARGALHRTSARRQ